MGPDTEMKKLSHDDRKRIRGLVADRPPQDTEARNRAIANTPTARRSLGGRRPLPFRAVPVTPVLQEVAVLPNFNTPLVAAEALRNQAHTRADGNCESNSSILEGDREGSRVTTAFIDTRQLASKATSSSTKKYGRHSHEKRLVIPLPALKTPLARAQRQIGHREDVCDLPEDGTEAGKEGEQELGGEERQDDASKFLEEPTRQSSITIEQYLDPAGRKSDNLTRIPEQRSEGCQDVSDYYQPLHSLTSQEYIAKEVKTVASGDKITHSQIKANQGEYEDEEESGSYGEPLDELELEILNLGRNDDAHLPSTPRSYLRNPVPAHSPKHPRTTNADDESDHAVNRPLAKKQRHTHRKNAKIETRDVALQKLSGHWASRGSRHNSDLHAHRLKKDKKEKKAKARNKSPRRVPVDELVTVSEIFQDSDQELPRLRPAEDSQDPISQLSATVPDHRHQIRKIRIKVDPQRGLKNIDITQFRIPKAHPVPANITSWSEGFEGNEGLPIGRLMPVKQSARKGKTYHKVTFKINELTIVMEREAGEVVGWDRDVQRQNKKRQQNRVSRRPRHHVWEAQCDQNMDNPFLIDQHEEQVTEIQNQRPPKDGLIQDPKTPTVTTSVESRSQLKPMDYQVEHVSPNEASPLHVEIPFSQRNPFGRRISDEFRVSQQLKMVTACAKKKTPKHSILRDLAISQQLSMVSIKRPRVLREDSEEDDSDDRRASDDEYESTLDSEESKSSEEDEKGDLAREEESGQENEDENENKMERQEIKGNLNVQNQVDESKSSRFVKFINIPTGAVPHRELAPSKSNITIATAPIEPVATASPLNIARGAEDSISLRPVRSFTEAQSLESLNLERNPCLLDYGLQLPHSGERLPSALRPIRYEEPTHRKRDTKPFAAAPLEPRIASSMPNVQPNFGDSRVVLMATSINTHLGSFRRQGQASVSMRNVSIDHTSWRPRKPQPSSNVMEVDEDIIDTPSPAVPVHTKNPSTQHRSTGSNGRRLSRIAGQALALVRERCSSPLVETVDAHVPESQGSIELEYRNGWQDFCRPLNSSIPETEFDNSPEPNRTEIYESQLSYITNEIETQVVPEASYLERASQNLLESIWRPDLSRTMSMPAKICFTQPNINMMPGRIAVPSTFSHKVSPRKTEMSRIPSLLEGTPSKNNILRTLTRQASIDLGTLPGCARRREVSLLFKPPFKDKGQEGPEGVDV